jgi:hypothetical protein
MAETTVETPDGFSVTSNHADEAEIRAAFEPEPSPEPTPEPEPEPDETKPAAVAEPKIDKRTREGKKLSIQQQIDADTARRYEAKQAADAEEARLAKIRADIASATAPPKPAETTAAPPVTRSEYERYKAMPGAPDINKYGEAGYEAYQFDVAAFVAEKRFEELSQRAEQNRVIRERSAGFQTRVQAEAAKDPAFLQRLNETPIDTRVIPYLHNHKQGEDVMVYLVEHPDIAQQLTLLNPIEQIGQIGEIAGELKARASAASSGPARPPAISNAKPPIKPLGSSPTVSDDVDPDSLSFEEHFKRENARDAKARKAGGRGLI